MPQDGSVPRVVAATETPSQCQFRELYYTVCDMIIYFVVLLTLLIEEAQDG